MTITPRSEPRRHVRRPSRFPLLLRLVAAAMMLAAWGGAEARADGKFFPLVVVGGEDDPTIPYQRAMIAYRDGVETLVVESTVESKGDALGWVIPLPTEPTQIEAAKPGTLESVYKLIGPRIDASGRSGLELCVFLFIFALLFSAAVAYDNHRGRQSLAVRSVLILSMFLIFRASVMLPSLGVGRGGLEAVARANVLQERQIGAYKVSIITGDSAEPIRAWLTENGFRVPESTVPVLDQYAKAGWCFSAARIATGGDGQLTPHPLKFVFKTPQPVYPMKLTGVDAGKLQLDLYVVADRAAEAAHMAKISCDTYRPTLSRFGSNLAEDWAGAVSAGELYKADDISISVGHPDATALMWPGCTLTHLRGTLSPTDMADDITIALAQTGSSHKKMYTHQAAMRTGWKTGTGLGTLILLPAAVVVWMRMRKHQQNPGWFRLCLIVALGLGLIGGSATFAVLPKLATDVRRTRSESHDYWLQRFVLHAYSSVVGRISRRDVTPDMQQFDRWWAKQVKEGMPRGEAKAGDIPHGYEIERADAEWALTLYDRYATPTRITIRAAAEQAEPNEPSG